MGHDDLGAGAGEALAGVMLGQPVALVAELLGSDSEVDGLGHGLGGAAPFGDR